MRAKLLKTPIKATIRPIENYNFYGYGIPSCCYPEYTPFKEQKYEATIHAVWFKALSRTLVEDKTVIKWGEDNTSTFLAIERDGKRLVVPSSFVSAWTVKDLFDNMEPEFIQSVDDAGRYGLKAFAEDALLMQSNFNVKIVSAIAKDRDAIAVKADYNWELHGHAKPVKGIEQYLCFSTQDKTEILIL